MMCEYCHQYPHHPRCPNAPEPEVRGYCENCGNGMREDYEYYTDKEDNKFCCQDCALEYHEIRSADWY